MLKEEVKQLLTDTLGMDLEALKSALTSEDEVEVSYKSGTFMDDEKLEAFKTNLKKQGYEEGKSAGPEMEAKKLKEELGLNIEGKDLKKIAEAYAKHKLEEAKIEPSKKIQELQESNEKLKALYQQKEQEFDSEKQAWERQLTDIKVKNDLQTLFPSEIKGLKPSQAAILARAEFDFDYDSNGQLIAKRGGKVLKDKLENPLPVQDVLTDFAKNNGWLGDNGRGGGDELGGSKKFKSKNEVFKYLEENNIAPDSEEAGKMFEQIQE